MITPRWYRYLQSCDADRGDATRSLAELLDMPAAPLDLPAEGIR
jgi:hypothetical protein